MIAAVWSDKAAWSALTRRSNYATDYGKNDGGPYYSLYDCWQLWANLRRWLIDVTTSHVTNPSCSCSNVCQHLFLAAVCPSVQHTVIVVAVAAVRWLIAFTYPLLQLGVVQALPWDLRYQLAWYQADLTFNINMGLLGYPIVFFEAPKLPGTELGIKICLTPNWVLPGWSILCCLVFCLVLSRLLSLSCHVSLCMHISTALSEKNFWKPI